jgi:hypothetical protein
MVAPLTLWYASDRAAWRATDEWIGRTLWAFSPLAGRRCREAADEGRHPAVVAPHPALRATLSPQAGRGSFGVRRAPVQILTP